MIHLFHDHGYSSIRQVNVPEVASVLGFIIAVFSLVSVFFLSHTMQLVAALFDFIVFVLYLASAILLRENYHSSRARNPLWRSLEYARATPEIDDGKLDYDDTSSRSTLHAGLVRLLVALTVIQTILFFFTTLLGAFVARRSPDDRTRTRHTV
jgi:preprotein translocase subunit SecG